MRAAARAWLRRRRSALVLVAVVLCLCGSSLLWSARQQNAYEASVRHQQAEQLAAQHREQAAAQRAAALIEQKLCLSLGRLAALRPPAGNPADNPSRAFEQAQHAILAGLGPDIGCKGG